MADSKKGFQAGLINQMGDLFLKLPALPKNVKDFIVLVIPWIALVFGVLGLLGSLTALGLGAFLTPFAFMAAGGAKTIGILTISVLIALLGSVLSLVAVMSLFSKKELGWILLFWGEVLSAIGAIVAFSLSGLVFSFIWFYVLFQIKSYYK